MADKEEILIEIIVSNDKATQAIFESQQSIEKLKQSQKDLTEEKKKGTLTEEEYSKKMTAAKVAISQQNEVIRLNEKELKNNIKAQKDNSDSLAALRAQLSNSTKAYDNLSKAERESAKGQDLQKSISETITQLNEAEQATGRFQRQVGKYPEQMGGAGKGVQQITGFLGKMGDQLGVTGGFAGNFSNTLNRASSVIGGFASKSELASKSVVNISNNLEGVGESITDLSKGAEVAGNATSGAFGTITKGAVTMGKAFLAPPIIIVSAIILAIIGAVKLLSEGFKKNDAASEKLSESFAIFTPILDAIGSLFAIVAEAVADLVLGFSKAVAATVDFVAGLFGVETGLSAAAEESRNLVRAQDELEEAERNFTVNSAKRNLERSKLMSEVANKEKNDAKTRIALLKDALDLDRQNLVDEKKIADEKLRIIEQIAKNENDTSDDTAKKIAEARAASLNAETKYFEGVKEINKKLSSAEEELANEQKARFETWKKNKDEQINKETQLLRQLEDLAIDQIKNDLQRQIDAEKVKTERANADLLKRLKTEENLTANAKKAINDIILLNEKNLIDKVNELNDKALDENIRKDLESKQKSLEAQLELSEKGSQDELNIKIARLTLERDAVLLNDELTNLQRLAIEDKFNKDSDALNDAYLMGRQQRLKESFDKEFQLRFLNAENNNIAIEEQKAIELERAILEAENLKNLDAETKAAMFQTQLDYEIAIAQSQQNIITAQENVTAAQLTSLLSFNTAMTNISQSIGAIISNLADDSYEAAQFQRALAVFNIGIALSESIAGVTKLAATRSFSIIDMLATIIAGTASVATSIAGAKKAFNDSPLPKKPAFASGGLISGRGTGTSDSIDIRASNGESVMNANTTSMFTPLLSSLNQAGGGVGFGSQDVNNQLQGEEMLARAFAKGAAMLPAPEVSVKEINDVNDRLTKLKEL